MSQEGLTFSDNFVIGYKTPVAKVETSFSIPFSENGSAITVLSGSNGSGKTTLLRTLSGIISPLSGAAYFNGTEIKQLSIQKKICYLPETLDFFSHLTPEQILRSQTNEKKENLLSLAAILELPFDKLPFWKLSKGNRQKVRFLLAYLKSAQSELVLLDEPFSGFDIASREIVMTLLAKLFHGSSRRLLISLHTEKLPDQWSDSSLGIVDGKINLGPAFTSVYDARNYFTHSITSN